MSTLITKVVDRQTMVDENVHYDLIETTQVNNNDIIFTVQNLYPIKREYIRRLAAPMYGITGREVNAYLNDEIINAILHLAQNENIRMRSLCMNAPKIRFLNTFFMAKLFDSMKQYDYNAVKRWTRRFNVFEEE